METRLATAYVHLSRSIPHSQSLASGGPVGCRFERSNFLGSPPSPSSKQFHRSSTSSCCVHPKSRVGTLRRRCCSFDPSSSSSEEEEFANKIQQLSLISQFPDADGDETESSSASDKNDAAGVRSGDGHGASSVRNFNSVESGRPAWVDTFLQEGAPEWAMRDDVIAASMERRANCVDLPLSLRIIKRGKKKKRQWQEAGESAYCSVKKAFSSMVFIIRELHAYTLQMRESIFYVDLREILVRVQQEMHASFVWLFQQVFSPTPTLMVYVMILLANFTVHSMANNAAMAASPPPPPTMTEAVVSSGAIPDSSATKAFTINVHVGGKAASVEGNKGGSGGKVRPVSSGTDGDGWLDRSAHGSSSAGSGVSFTPRELDESSVGSGSGSGQAASGIDVVEELSLWDSMVEEAKKLEATFRDESLDGETARGLVSPVTARIEPDEYADYFKTELLYQAALAQDPDNPLLLTNFAQFLYLVAHAYDRAEECFKRAAGAEPPDAVAYSRYATFLWVVRKDLWGAEEAYLEAISADPTNPFYAANYAHFLWSTGGEDTCFPLTPPDGDPDMDRPSP